MINKRLIRTIPESKPHIIKSIFYQWVTFLCNIILIIIIGLILDALIKNEFSLTLLLGLGLFGFLVLAIRFYCTCCGNRESYYASKNAKITLRELIYNKLLKLGVSYTDEVSTAEVVQISVEGVEQLETYFGAYLPHFFYSMLAPITLFFILSFISLKIAVILFLCVPLIPISIILIQKFAKKLLSKYWSQYAKLGDSFLENLQGLTTLKIYQSDEFKHNEMNQESEHFRKVTMKVLTMQLNSITIMDLVTYGGIALGTILSVLEYANGRINFLGCFIIIMLSANFFLPLRMLGSYFHIAMNGITASNKIFKLLDLPVDDIKTAQINDTTITIENVSYAYNSSKNVLQDITMKFPKYSFTSIVGESGCGKSTIAGILMGINKGFKGDIHLGDISLSDIKQESLMKNITLISVENYIFKGTVRENLLMGNPDANDFQLWESLESVNLADFLRNEKGLETNLMAKGSNISGGQLQRLNLARGLLHNSEIYIFDEATSNIDVESENDIMRLIHKLTKTKTVILISHRLANIVDSDMIYVLENGYLIENGTHQILLTHNSVYSKLWYYQKELEIYTKGENQ
jgi:ATP-binding cassette subfamily C protein